jgi:alkylation response protein AidB-like acyl-CoA dehydrogenase
VTSTDERRALRDATSRLLRASTPVSANDHVAATSEAPDRATWRALAERLGLQGVRVPEELGGAGLELAEELLVHEEMGRALHGGPFLPVVAQAVPALLGLVDRADVRALLVGVTAGETIVVPAYSCWYDAAAPWPVLVAGRVSGTVPGVMEPVGADAYLVAALDAGEPAVVLVQGTEPGVSVLRLPSVDLTRRFGDVRLEAAAGVVLATGERARGALASIEAGGTLALAAECVGVAAEAFETTVDYLKVREQFGQVIGSFQAVKHQAADLLVLLESARSALAFALDAVDAETHLRSAALAVARRRCGTAAFRITNEAIHLHGGIGFTWEHRIHLYHRRAKTNEVLLDEQGIQARALAAEVAALYAQRVGR